MPRPHRRRQIDNRVEEYVRGDGPRDHAQQALLLGVDLPQHERGDGDGAQDLRAEGVEEDEEGRPRVVDRLQRDEGGLPLDAGERGLVAGFEVVEGTQQAEDDGADGALAQVVGVDDFEEGEELPHQHADGAGAHWFLEECDGEVPDGDEEGVAAAVDVCVAVDDDLLVGLALVVHFDVEERFGPVVEGVADAEGED